MKKPHSKQPIFTSAFFNRFVIVTLIYVLAGTIVWSTIARIFPDGIEPPWLFWLVIGISILVYVAAVVAVEAVNRKRTR
ncbi:MAG: hypothetical protein WC399_02675 [Bacilli bacterium]|jgi:divalent metal cation (Fe/Co/Zn/Cd) transporter